MTKHNTVEDRGGASYRRFGHDHLCHASRIRTDAWPGAAVGPADFAGLAQSPLARGDWDSSLPMAHRVASNSEAFAKGAFRGVSASHMQPCADELGWRHGHGATRDAAADLLRDMCLGHVPLGDITATATTQPKMVQ